MPHAMKIEDPHFQREDRTERWRRIARHLEKHPEDLTVALANIERWLALGRVHPAPILEWRRRILDAQRSPAAMRQLLEFLATPNHDSEPIKSCSPFVGFPTEEDPSPPSAPRP